MKRIIFLLVATLALSACDNHKLRIENENLRKEISQMKEVHDQSLRDLETSWKERYSEAQHGSCEAPQDELRKLLHDRCQTVAAKVGQRCKQARAFLKSGEDATVVKDLLERKGRAVHSARIGQLFEWRLPNRSEFRDCIKDEIESIDL